MRSTVTFSQCCGATHLDNRIAGDGYRRSAATRPKWQSRMKRIYILSDWFYLLNGRHLPLIILSAPVRSTARLYIFTLVERTDSDRMTNRHLFHRQHSRIKQKSRSVQSCTLRLSPSHSLTLSLLLKGVRYGFFVLLGYMPLPVGIIPMPLT